MPNRAKVSITLAKLNINATNKKSLEEMKILTDLWMEDLGLLSDHDFLEAVKTFRRSSSFFPTTAEILKIHMDRMNRVPVYPAIDYQPSPISKAELAEMLKPLREKLKWLRGR